ncbi:hypothetical protein [Streptomyces apricus]|uniref:Uncharacterized protein n=1 Tax=Streptomyces apricus TaxID=1828112 RepID=A0A5B0BDC4_9ACTN|nr:hypothetical protein [Streptomyces apricus]KAA0940114.1 hypothetical protein FGF04_11610 [Streptomyces apricus]
MSAALLSLLLYTLDDKSDDEVFPVSTEATSPAVARTVREHLHLSRPSGEEKMVRMTVDGILREQHYNAITGSLDFLDDEGEVVDRVPFQEEGLAIGSIESSTSEHIPHRRVEDITSVRLGPGLKFSQWRDKP